MSSFGDRLREARGTLSQAEFGRLGGVQRNAQAKYESGERSPDAKYLEALAASGVNIVRLLTGDAGEGLHDRSRAFQSAAPTAEETGLLRDFRRLTDADRATVLKVVASLVRAAG